MSERYLNGANIKSEADFHREIASLFGFPDYYGRNLNALWDCMIPPRQPGPVRLVWRNSDLSKRAMGTKVFNDLVDVLDDVSTWQRDEAGIPEEECFRLVLA